jgi:hypothetical protein
MPIPPGARWSPGTALAACWAAGWPGACAVVSVVVLTAIYRLLAERERRKVLLDIYLNAPAGTEVVQGRGPAGPPMRVRVGNDNQPPATSIVMTHAMTLPVRGRLARRSRP